MTGGRLSAVKGRERCQRTVSHPPSGIPPGIVAPQLHHCPAASRETSCSASGVKGRKGRRVLPVNGGWAEKVPCAFERPIRQARSIASAQRRTDAVGALVLGATRHGGIAWRRPIRCGCLRLLGCAHARGGRDYRGAAGKKRAAVFARKWVGPRRDPARG